MDIFKQPPHGAAEFNYRGFNAAGECCEWTVKNNYYTLEVLYDYDNKTVSLYGGYLFLEGVDLSEYNDSMVSIIKRLIDSVCLVIDLQREIESSDYVPQYHSISATMRLLLTRGHWPTIVYLINSAAGDNPLTGERYPYQLTVIDDVLIRY